MKRKAKSKPKDPDLDVEDAETLVWTCSACGADNPDSRQKCISCGGDRAGDTAAPKPKEPADELENFEAPKRDNTAAEATFPEPAPLSSDTDEEKPESSPSPFSVDTNDSADEKKDELVKFTFDTEPEKTEPPIAEPEIKPFLPTPSPYSAPPSARSTGAGTGRFYMVFVNTPAQSLIKSKVPIEFEDFPVVSIGRSPENVIVIPDAEVSRKHAELTLNGGALMLKDLNSKNGTFLYSGKEFQQVHDSVEVKPNSIVKFGTGTIVRLTGE